MSSFRATPETCGRFAGLALLALAVLVAGGLGCGKRGHSADAGGATPTTVSARVEPVTSSSVDVVYEAVGSVRSKTVSTIQSKVMGRVTAVHFTVGLRVEIGALLLEIDDREAQAQVQHAESGLKEAEDALREIGQSVNAAKSAQSAADTARDLAKATYERYKGLSEGHAVSKQAYDEAASKSQAAEAEARRASEMLGASESKRQEIASKIDQAKANIESAKANLSHTKVTAPMAGLVTMKNVDTGDLAAPGTPLLEIVDDTHFRLEAAVDESQMPRIPMGGMAQVSVDALGGKPLDGTVAEAVPSADVSSRTFIVKVDVPAIEGVWSGMFGRARFVTGSRKALTVPVSAVQHRGQLASVFVVDPEQVARLRIVTLGSAHGDRVEVLSGLSEGDPVVVEGLDRVSDGVRIEHATAR